jgi:2-dehydro-3-deoxyphosphooctonate aldolase (KDO 8-P synthase)
VLTDVHSEDEILHGGRVVDVLQTPAFCAARPISSGRWRSGRPVNIKKGQFLAPGDMKNVIDKARAAAQEAGLEPMTTSWPASAGASFGYNNLVSDMRALAIMRDTGCAGGV